MLTFGSTSGFGDGSLPVGSVLEDVQQPLDTRHVVGVGRGDPLPLVGRAPTCRKIEHGHQPDLAVGAVLGECLAEPFAGHQDAAPSVTEVLVPVGLAWAETGDEVGARVAWLDAVPKPVRARW